MAMSLDERIKARKITFSILPYWRWRHRACFRHKYEKYSAWSLLFYYDSTLRGGQSITVEIYSRWRSAKNLIGVTWEIIGPRKTLGGLVKTFRAYIGFYFFHISIDRGVKVDCNGKKLSRRERARYDPEQAINRILQEYPGGQSHTP